MYGATNKAGLKVFCGTLTQAVSLTVYVHTNRHFCVSHLSLQGWSSAYSIESVIMQINATLVKGKARVQFGANKVFIIIILIFYFFIIIFLMLLFICKYYYLPTVTCNLVFFCLFVSNRTSIILPEHNNHTSLWSRSTKRMVRKLFTS